MADGSYNAYDVTGGVTGNGSVAFALTGNNATQRYFNSKEASTSKPQLVVSYVA
jgi:hypothetical protein